MFSDKRLDAANAFDREFHTRDWIDKIPSIQFPAHWKVQLTPPFAGAIVRFRVLVPGREETNGAISVYLDGYEMLGCSCFRGPYWEIYPDAQGENDRFSMDNTEGLLEAIQEAMDHYEKNLDSP